MTFPLLRKNTKSEIRLRGESGTTGTLPRPALPPPAACPQVLAAVGRGYELHCRLALACVTVSLCAGFSWPGRLPRLAYESAHGDANARLEAVRLLGQYPAQSATAALLPALEDDDVSVQLAAAGSLGQVHATTATPALIDWLDEQDSARRASAVRALGLIGDARSKQGLTRALGDQDAAVRVAAIEALGRQPGDNVASVLASFDDKDSNVRAAVALVLEQLRDASTLAALSAHTRDESAEVRGICVRALGGLHDARALPALTQAIGDRDERVRLQAIAALGDTHSAQAVTPLRARLRAEPRAAKTALSALARIPDPSAARALLAELGNPDLAASAASALLERARRAPPGASDTNAFVLAAANALANARTQEHGTVLANALAELVPLTATAPAKSQLLAALEQSRAEPSSLTRALLPIAREKLLPALLERLGRAETAEHAPVLDALELSFDAGLADGRAVEPLAALLSDAATPMRAQLLRLLGMTRAPRVLPLLTAALTNASSAQQREIVAAIGQLPGSDETRAVLRRLLDAPDPALRLSAASALGYAADDATVHALLRAIGDEPADGHDGLLLALSTSLLHLGGESKLAPELRAEVLKSIRPLLQSVDTRVVARALDVLRNLHDARAIPLIAQLLRGGSARNRAAAVFALRDFPHEDTRRLLRFVLRNDGAQVALSAAIALGEVGDQRDATALVQAARRGIWPLPAATAFALTRIAERSGVKKHGLQRALCELGESTDPLVRANVAAGLATLAATPCSDSVSPRAWLAPEQPSTLRIAAALWAHSDGSDAQTREQLLQPCRNDSDAEVASACRMASAPGPWRKLDLYARDAEGNALLRERLVALRLAGGSVFIGYTDANAHVLITAPAVGAIALDDPADTQFKGAEPGDNSANEPTAHATE